MMKIRIVFPISTIFNEGFPKSLIPLSKTRVNENGYTYLLLNNKFSFFTKVCAVADCYDLMDKTHAI